MGSILVERDETTSDDRWRAIHTARIINWSIAAGIVFFVTLWLVGGYFHARWRVKNGKEPLFYDRGSQEQDCHVLRANNRQFLAPSPPQPDPALSNQFSFYKIPSPGFAPSRLYDGKLAKT